MTNTPLRVAIAGFGASAKTFHAPFLRALWEDFQVTAVWERKAIEAQAVFENAKVHTDWKAFVRDPDYDLAIVCLPNDLHADMTVELLMSGRHVVVEKPMAVGAKQAHRILAAEKKSGKNVFVFHSRRLDGDFQAIQNVVRAGTLGRIVRTEIRYDRWSNALRKKAWKEQGKKGSTLLEDLGSHLLDQALTLYGTPRALDCRLEVQRDASSTVDAFRIELEYDGFSVGLESSMLVKQPPFHWAVYGTGGTLIKHGMDAQEAQLQAGVSVLDPSFGRQDREFAAWLYPGEGGVQRVETPKGSYLEFFRTVANVLRTGASHEFGSDRGLAVVELIDACWKSHERRRRIDVSILR